MKNVNAHIEAMKRNADDSDLWDVTIEGDDGERAFSVTYRDVDKATAAKWQRWDAANALTMEPRGGK